MVAQLTARSVNTVQLAAKHYHVAPGGYDERTMPYFAPDQRREGRPGYKDTVFQQIIEMETFHRGFGLARLTEPGRYAGSHNCDASYRRFLTLGPLDATIGEANLSVPLAFQFNQGTYTGDGTNNRAITGLGFQPKVVVIKGDTGANGNAMLRTDTMNASENVATTVSATTDQGIQSLDPDGFTVNNFASINGRTNENGKTYYWFAFGGASVKTGTYVGDGTASHAITGIGFRSVMLWVTQVTTPTGPVVLRTSTMGAIDVDFNATGFSQLLTTRTLSLDTDGFTIGSHAHVNTTGTTYHYVAFNADGRLAMGTYTGNGVDNRDLPSPTPLGFNPALVLTKDGSITQIAQWRALVQPGDATFEFQAGGAIAGRIKSLTATAGQFRLGTDVTVNANGDTYHFFAAGISTGNAGAPSGPTKQTGAFADFIPTSLTPIGFTPGVPILCAVTDADLVDSPQLQLAVWGLNSSDQWQVIANASVTETNAVNNVAIFKRSLGGGVVESVLYIGTSNGKLYRYNGFTQLSQDAVTAYWVAVTENVLWRVYQDTALGWAASKSSDGNTWGPGFRIGDGTHKPTWVFVYGDRFFICDESGIHSIDDAGGHDDLLPEQRLANDPLMGLGAGVASDTAIIPQRGGNWEWRGGLVAEGFGRLTLAAADARIDSSVQRGRIHHIIPLAPNAAIGFLTDDKAQTNALAKRVFYPDTYESGLGYHPIVDLPAGLPPRAIWARPNSAAGLTDVYVAQPGVAIKRFVFAAQQLPSQATGLRFQPSGTFQLSTLDADMSSLTKAWLAVEILVDLPSGTSVSVSEVVDGTASVSLGTATSSGTQALVTFAFPSPTGGRALDGTFTLATTNPAVTPAIRRVTVRFKIRPPVYHLWSLTFEGAEDFPQWTLDNVQFVLSYFSQQAASVTPTAFIDVWGRQWTAFVESAHIHNLAKLDGANPNYGIVLQLTEVPGTLVGVTIWSQLAIYTWGALNTNGWTWDFIRTGIF